VTDEISATADVVDTEFTDLPTYLADEGERVEAALRRAMDGLRGHDASFDFRLAPDVEAAIRHGVLSGGKRLRPVLCVSAFAACGGERSLAAYDLAASLEMIHAYSLMHDDLPCMDDADLRRGRTTTHREYGEDVTMRAGAVLIPLATLQALGACRALGVPDERARSVALTLGPERLDALHRRKTGALLTSSLVMGALAAGASDAVTEALRGYGRAIGLAFQIADDILDATQDAETLGKNPSDAALDKSTYVSLYGLDEATERARVQVDLALGALRGAVIRAPALEALATYVVDRGK
jgi:geranylgeranyl pyrophosphate synthase